MPLMGQAGNVLRSFNRYLGQAIHTAKTRQTRYQLPWERVHNLRTIRVEPIDSLLRVPRQKPGAILVDWPNDKNPDLSQPGFVPKRSLPIQFKDAIPTDDGFRVITEPALLPTDRVIWCEVDSAVSLQAVHSPNEVIDSNGNSLRMVSSPRMDADQEHWLLHVAGKMNDCDLLVDGVNIEAEAIPVYEGLNSVQDETGASYEVSAGTFRVEEAPHGKVLQGDDGMRYHWRGTDTKGRRGCWIQLLSPESSQADEFLDPRAAFCEGDVGEVWSQPRRKAETTFRVKKVDQDRYQLLLNNYPPKGSTLYLPVDLRNLYLQKRALRQLSEAPLPHHDGLLRLCEDPQHARWPRVSAVSVGDGDWKALTDVSRSGTDEQRSFVENALGSPDFAFLEGPPGSGKTTAICEIVEQLIEKGERVLLCASTHVAIDNVLERLLESSSSVDAVRIGKLDKVDDKVSATQLDERIKLLVSEWRAKPTMNQYGDAELEEMAERTVIMAANLTCATTMGIVNHPLFRERDAGSHISEQPITKMPHWDVLIVDEASKTLIQEFMVPALMAKRWFVIGDVRQLPPFADRADIIANIRDLVDEKDRPVFPADHQRACLLLFRLLRKNLRQSGMRWLLVERTGVLHWIVQELKAQNPEPGFTVVHVVSKARGSNGPVAEVTVHQLRNGHPESLLLAAADWVFVSEDIISEVAELLPSNLLMAEKLNGSVQLLTEGDIFLTRQAWWLEHTRRLEKPYRDGKYRREDIVTFADTEACERDWLLRNDLAQELAWRLTRIYELRHSHSQRRQHEWLSSELKKLQPKAVSIEEPLAEINDIGLPSILEVLQEGIGVDRATRRSALTVGLRKTLPRDFGDRFGSLSFQHRMHPDIASFSRDVIYDGKALQTANTIEIRDKKLVWDFGDYKSRRVWINVNGREEAGVNKDEIQAMADVIGEFIEWARHKGPPQRDLPRVWEVACLCFYVKQERAISDKLREITGDDRKTRFKVNDAPVEIVCGTVDRFQGREADLVMLSMRNTRRVGFMDSPNRLNVGVTRARQQLIVCGNHNYFKGCRVSELEALAEKTHLIQKQDMPHRRGKR